MNRVYLSSLAAASFFITGCLPGDTRPEPGRVVVEVEATSRSVNGFTTHDGWSVSFDRLLVGLGNILLGKNPQHVGDCRVYENADYIRLFDFTVPGRQKLGEAYGLDDCALFLGFHSPSVDSLLQNGVTTTDRDFMLGSMPEQAPMQLVVDVPPPRTAIYMRGSATDGVTTKRFAWRFVARDAIGYCGSIGYWTTQMHLSGGDHLHAAVSFDGAQLFGVSAYHFETFAEADVDGDDEITEEELDNQFNFNRPPGEMDAREFGLDGSYWQTVLPTMVTFNGAACSRVAYEAQWGGGDGPF